MNETIAALSTAPQTAGIHVIRMSGDDSVEILKRVFEPASKIESFEHAHMYYGRVVDNGVALDEVYAVSFYQPKSYTGENVVEIQCHGSGVLSGEILKLLLKNGATPAQPGEFTKRAYLNGKLDLVQAESVMDLLNATGKAASKNAYEQLSGHLSERINSLKDIFVFVMANIDVDIDFPEADVEVVDRELLSAKLCEAKRIIDGMLSSVDEGRIIKEGIRVAICGLPNAGKSSLLNYLIGDDRAIVTDIPGTTRDVIEESVMINGIRVRLFDTAGLRHTEDKIESIGIQRTKRAIDDGDIVLVMIDGTSESLGDENTELLHSTRDKKRIVALNKSDADINDSVIKDLDAMGVEYVVISARTGDNIDLLKDKIYQTVMGGNSTESVCLTNARQIHCIRHSGEALQRAMEDMDAFMPLDIVGIGIREAYEGILELVGEGIDDSIINEIFTSFCLGK
ncbi:MAG: tRNA uridine-5-carboxymethylaminomethyl(34) synthesis GTPase MnmE [Clostridia bacterium]|nr:tRNA uridine-5-carboxymethylaminomethyl(34) synthesis GTPase MnmE [Clostridia bacterium]